GAADSACVQVAPSVLFQTSRCAPLLKKPPMIQMRPSAETAVAESRAGQAAAAVAWVQAEPLLVDQTSPKKVKLLVPKLKTLPPAMKMRSLKIVELRPERRDHGRFMPVSVHETPSVELH